MDHMLSESFNTLNFSITSARFPSIFLLYAKGNLSFIVASTLPPAFVNMKAKLSGIFFFIFFSYTMSINNSQQLLESFHC